MKELKYLNKYLFKYKIQLITGIFIAIIARIFALFAPRLVNNSLTIVEEFIKFKNISIEHLEKELIINITLIIITAVISGFLTFLIRQTIINVSRYIEFDLKNEIYDQYQKLDLEFYKKNKTGDLMTRITEDVSKVRMYFGPAIMYSINTTVLFIIVIASMISLAPKLAIYSLIPLPFLSIIIFVLSREINKKTSIIQKILSKLSSFSQESFSGITVIKSHGIESKVEKKFELISKESKESNLKLAKIQAWFFPLMILLIGLSNYLVIFIGGIQYINGEINIGVLAEFILYVSMLTWPVATVGWVTSIVQQAEASQKRINVFLKKRTKIKSGNLKKKISGSIEFKNVFFKYQNSEKFNINGMSFKIKKGDRIGIIGNIGSGKSTILNLISRLYDIKKGNLYIDGIDVKKFDINTLRNSISYVPQDSFLFSDTIIENIKFGNEKSSLEDVVKYTSIVEIHEEIKKFNKGYDTLIGERGITLSGGQRQRLSIARALIKNSKIILFDDCFSAIDSQTQKKILENLNHINEKKTMIIISHNISSIINCNKVLVIDKGRIIQHGTNSELKEIDGYYKYLFERQKLEKL